MSTQTMVKTMETISQTIVPKGDNSAPPPPNTSNHHQNPQHIRDTFDTAFGRAPGGPRGPRGPGNPHGPGGIPPAHLIPIQPGADLKPAGIPLIIFDRDHMCTDTFMHKLRIYMMANQGVPSFESLIRRITITLTFIKELQVDGWVEGILKGLKQLHLVADNIKYTYINFLV